MLFSTSMMGRHVSLTHLDKHEMLLTDTSDPAKIQGTVSDSLSGEKLIGATVYVDGTGLGTVSDLNGEYVIPSVPAGTYNLIIRYIGYKEVTQKDVVLKAGQTLELDILMSPEGVNMTEVVISAQVTGQRAAINQQLASNAITNIVSSDKIKDVPDVNAAESIGRLPGVSLKRSGGEGNKIVVRGLSPQYTIVEIDGVRMTGVDGDRSVGLSIISSEMLEGIELSKSLTPDKDADAIGGVVNLRLREAAKGFHYGGLALGGYNGLENSLNNYKFSAYVSNRFFENKFGVLVNASKERVIRSSDRFSATYAKNIAETDDLYTTSARVSERKAIRERAHGSVMLDYKSKFVKVKLNNFFSQMINENEVRDNIFRFNNNDFLFQIADSRPVESIRSHALHTTFNIFNTNLNANVSISKTVLNTESDRYNFRDENVLGGSSISENRKLFAMPSTLIDEFFDISSSMQSVMLDNVRSTSMRDDQTKTANLNWEIPFRFSKKISGQLEVGAKYSRKERSNDTESKQAYYWGGIGIARVRDYVNPEFPDFYTQQDVGITNAEGLVGYNFDDPGYDYGEILDGRYTLGWSADLEKLKEVHDHLYSKYEENMLWRQGVQSNRDDYLNIEERKAAYIMAEINLGKRIMLLPGVRYEDMHTEYTASYLQEDSFDPDGLRWARDVTAVRDNAFFFPSVNMKIKTNEWSDIRAAVYRSASRPDYRFLSPGMTANDNKTRLTSYNPYLKPSLATNYDLGASFYSNKLGLFTVNAFYKEISNLIYRLPRYQPEYFDRLGEGTPEALLESLQAPRSLYDEDLYNASGTSNNNIPINNPNLAYFSGFEVGLQTNFWYLKGFWSGFVIDLNYSRIWSKTEFPYLDIIITFEGNIIPIPVETPVYKTREARMLDQPASLFNARIGYDYKGFSSRISFRYQGATIAGLDPVHSLLDEVKGDVFRIDVSLKQKITEHLSFSLDLVNLTEFIDDSYLLARDYVMPRTSEFYGFTSQFGLRLQF